MESSRKKATRKRMQINQVAFYSNSARTRSFPFPFALSLSRLSRSARNFRERFVCVSRPKSRKPKAASLKYLHKPDKLSHFKRLTIKNEQCLFKQPPSSDSLLELTHSTQLDSAKWRQSDEKAPRARVLDSPRQF